MATKKQKVIAVGAVVASVLFLEFAWSVVTDQMNQRHAAAAMRDLGYTDDQAVEIMSIVCESLAKGNFPETVQSIYSARGQSSADQIVHAGDIATKYGPCQDQRVSFMWDANTLWNFDFKR